MIQILNKQDFIERLKQIIKAQFDDNVTNFAKKAGIHPSRMHDYLKGGCFPKEEKLEKIIQAAGISIDELCGEKPSKWTEAGEGVAGKPVIQYEGPERRLNWPYTHDEQEYIGKLVAILRGKNKKNVSAIKENIDAFYETKDVIPGELKKTKEA